MISWICRGLSPGKLDIEVVPVSLQECLEQCCQLVEQQANEACVRIELDRSLEGPWMLLSCPVRLKQVILNLLTNAIKYNRPEGWVKVAVKPLSNRRLKIMVEDNGEGINDRDKAQVFEPFARFGQRKGYVEGTGIGLSVCKSLIEAMDGEIGFDSQPGKGTLFFITLPLDKAVKVEDPDANETTEPPFAAFSQRHQDKSLLYIEDNTANLQLLKSLIEGHSQIRFLSASDAESGILLAKMHLPDVIIMDIDLPGMSGLQATRVLGKDKVTRHIPVIALSAAVTDKDISEAQDVGFVEYLAKPFEVEAVFNLLDKVLDHKAG